MMTTQALEAINGTLLVIFLGLEFFFARYIWLAIKWHGLRVGYRQRQAAIAMFLMLGGDTIIRGSVWFWRHFGLSDNDARVTVATSIGVVICICGGSCALRHFAPDEWGRAPWIMIPIIGVLFGVGMALR